MAQLLKGGPAAKKIKEELAIEAERLCAAGIVPALAVLRVGERDDDLAYERGVEKTCDQVGVRMVRKVLPADVSEEVFLSALDELNKDDHIHGILLFMPLPKQLNKEKARKLMAPAKDIDGITDMALAGLLTGGQDTYAPCTAEAVIRILDHYGIECTGKRVVVIGRSLVIGKPVSLMLMNRNATVTVCHTKTVNMEEITRQADIVVVASGKMESIGASYLKEGQVVIDVGIHWNEEKGKLCGDVKFDEAEPLAAAITPVPGGVGNVTTAVLISHVIRAAKKAKQVLSD